MEFKMNIKFTEQEMIELTCMLGETKEYKVCQGFNSFADDLKYDFSEEEIQNMKIYLVPLFKKLGMLK